LKCAAPFNFNLIHVLQNRYVVKISSRW